MVSKPSFCVLSLGDTYADPTYLVGELAWFLLCTLLVTYILASIFTGSKLVWFYCALFCWHTPWPFPTREWAGPTFIMLFSCDTHLGFSLLGGELALFSLCPSLGTLTIAFFFSVGKLAWFYCEISGCYILWPFFFQYVSWLGFYCVLFWWHILWLLFFEQVSWPDFAMHSSGDTNFHLMFFTRWVGVILFCTFQVTHTLAF